MLGKLLNRKVHEDSDSCSWLLPTVSKKAASLFRISPAVWVLGPLLPVLLFASRRAQAAIVSTGPFHLAPKCLLSATAGEEQQMGDQVHLDFNLSLRGTHRPWNILLSKWLLMRCEAPNQDICLILPFVVLSPPVPPPLNPPPLFFF